MESCHTMVTVHLPTIRYPNMIQIQVWVFLSLERLRAGFPPSSFVHGGSFERAPGGRFWGEMEGQSSL